jgi:hypothetical protein
VVDAGQGRAVRRSPGQSTGTAVPRSSRPYPSRPIYGGGGYYRPYYPYYRSYYPYYRSYYYPYYYGGFYSPFYFSFGLGWGYPYSYPYSASAYGPYGYPYAYAPYYGPIVYDTASARLQVTPRTTQVYVDGYFAGLVDEFDGYMQRLNVAPGQHELTLYLEGHRNFSEKILFTRGNTVKVIHTMQPLGPGETSAPPPTPVEPPRPRADRPPAGDYQAPPPRYDRQPPPRGGGQASDFGSLLLRVRPGDADILVDGEVWNAPEGQDQLVIELAEGTHRIDVRKNGFQTYSTTVRVRRGETVRLNVSLTAGGLTGE